jgi:hypothetical protein
MFNLIVSGGGWANGRFDFFLNRIFEDSAPDVVPRFSTERGPDFNALMQLPTLFMNEGRDFEVARLGRVIDVRVLRGGEISVSCTLDAEIPGIQNRTLVELAADLDMDEWEFGRNHWAVKNVDIYRTLLRLDLRRRVTPRVFRIADHENVEADLVSVMMPFDAGFQPVYQALRELCGQLRRRCIRADDIWENDVVMQDVVSLIDRSRVVIADCSGRNPNVFYEIGIAHTLGRDVLMITQAEADVPFDLRHLRFVQYLNNAEGRVALADTLRGRFEALR